MEVMMKKYLRLVLVVLPGIFLSNFLNSAVYYVATTGNDSTGNGSSSTPWKTLAYAVSHVPVVSGNTVHLNAGTFNETAQSVIPLGINIEGAGPTQTIINSSYAGILLSLQSSSISNGNQTISNLAIRGNNTVKEAIRVQKRNNVVMRELDVRDIAENGIILYGDDSASYSNNVNIYNSSFSNISTNLPGGWFKYDQGAIRIHRIDGCEIKNVQITNTLSTQGGGIKFYLPNNPSVKNLKIHDCNIVSRYLDIELWTMSDGCEIYNNRFAGWLSLLGTGKGAKSYGLYVHDNIFSYSIENLYGGMGKYCIELSISDAIIENNYFENYPEGAIDMWEYSTHNNITIRNNIFYNLQWHAILVGVPSGFNTFKVYNNVFHSNKGSTPALRMRFASGGTLSNADIKNNIFMGDNLGNSVITREGTASLTNAVFSNNLTYQINTDLTGFAQSNNLLNTNPQIKATGSRRDTYYQLNSISPCIDAGTNVGLSYNGTAPDIGRWESSYSSNLINVKNYGATGNGSTNDATSIQNAINDCPTGGTVYFPNGTYLLNSTLTLPVQKSLQGESKTGTILKGNHTNHMITGINTTHVNGNQSVYNFTIDGNHKSIGLDFWGRDNLNFYNLSITHMENAGGALFVHSTDNANDPQCSREHPPLFYINNVNISSCTFSDNNGGSIGLLGIDGGNIHNNTHNERNGSTGTGLTCWAQGWLKNVKIHDSTFSCWRDIELMNMIGGNEIYNCNFTGWVSIPDGGLASGFTYSLAVHDNVFSYIAAGCDTQHHALEAGNSDMLIYNNYFENYEAGIQMFATAPFNDNITIRNNVFYNIGGLYTYLATIGLGAGSATENDRQNIKILNNTFHVFGAYSPIVISGGTSSPKLTNCEIKNNIFYGNNTGTPVISRNGTAFTYTNCSFTNNLTYNLNNGDFSGFTQTSNKLSTNPLITGSGNKPTPYYTLQNGSPCIDAGVNVGLAYNGTAPDIGRYEYSGAVTPVYTVTCTANPTSIVATGTSQSTITATVKDQNNNNATGQVTFSVTGSGTLATSNPVNITNGIATITLTSTLTPGTAAVTATYSGKTGSVNVTVTAPASTVNVKDYGATGNGTTNDAPAIQNAINDCPTGGTVYFPAGTYKVNSTLILPIGVSLVGVSTDNVTGTIIKAGHSGMLINANSSVDIPVNGNQSISYIYFNGNSKQAGAALHMEGRHNFQIHHCEFKYFNDIAIWIEHYPNGSTPQSHDYMTGVKIYNCYFTESSSDHPGYSNGALCVGGLDGGEIYNCNFYEQFAGIKQANLGYIKNTKIHDCNITVWGAGQAYGNGIPIEMWNLYNDCEIYNITTNGWFSIVGGDKGTGTNSVHIHDCRMVRSIYSQLTYAIELEANDMLISENYIEGYFYGLMNSGSTQSDVNVSNLRILNNVMVNGSSESSFMLAGGRAPNNWRICNNTFKFNATGKNFLLIGKGGQRMNDLQIRNNIFISNGSCRAISFPDGGGADNSYFTNNDTYNTSNGSVNGWTVSNNITGDPSLTGSGNVPDPYYRLKAGSPCIDKGAVIAGITDGYSGAAPDIGRYEFGGAVTPVYTVTCTANPTSIVANGTSQSTITATVKDQNNNNATGQVTFSVTGSGTLSSPTTVNLVNGVVTITLTSTNTPGTAAVTATYSGKTGSINVTVTAPVVVQTNPVGNWHFEEGTGNSAGDSSVSGSSGTINGATWTTGKVGNGLQFNGTDNYVSIPNSAGLNTTDAVTISIWAYPTRIPVMHDDIVSKDDRIGIRWDGASLRPAFIFKIADGGSNWRWIILPDEVSLNTWVHLVATYDKNGGANNMRLYVDGVQKGVETYTDTIESTANLWTIGRFDTRYFQGKLDEVKIYNRALTAAEVLAEYNSGNNPPVDNPPQVALVVPTNNSMVSGIVTISGTATDDKGLTTVKFYISNSENPSVIS